MNTNHQVFDLRKFEFFITIRKGFIIKGDGSYDCSSAQFFNDRIKEWNNLTKDEKTACSNFVKSMDNKYGKGKHEYKIPKSKK